MIEKIRTVLSYIVLFIGLFVLAAVASYMYMYFNDAKTTKDSFDEVKEIIKPIEDSEDEEIVRPDYSDLLKQNSDFIGWIKIDGTNIDFPVVYTPAQEDYYLHRNFNKEYDYGGVPFCGVGSDVVRPSDNITIYGHHMRSGLMFHDLDKYREKEFYNKHKEILFDTIYRWSNYEVVSVYLTDVNPGCFEYWKYTDCTEEEFNEYKNYFTNHALYKTDLIDSVEYDDKLISLSTCAYHVTNGRLVVVAKMIESEETELYNSLEVKEDPHSDKGVSLK